MQRMTKQRRAVLDELGRVQDFRSAQQIFEDLHTRGERVGLATVYRSLQGLADDHRVDVLRSADGEALYRACDSQGHHHHLVCRSCGTTVEVSAAPLETWVARISQKNGFTDVEHTAELFGLCAACSARQG